MNAIPPISALRFHHERLRAARKAQGRTQLELAFALNTSPQNISNWESGRSPIRADRLSQLAAILGKTPEHFYGPETVRIDQEAAARRG